MLNENISAARPTVNTMIEMQLLYLRYNFR